MGIVTKLGSKSIRFRVVYTYCEFCFLWLTLPIKAIVCLVLEVIAGMLLGVLSTKDYVRDRVIPISALKDCLKRRKECK